MSFLDRLQTASYISPSGQTFDNFAYTALSRAIKHRIGSFEFPGINGTAHQDKGVSGETYPLNIIFYGPDYDLIADRFLEAAKETGNGFLAHPRWGRRRVQLLSCQQVENFTEDVGQAVFEVKFQESLQREFPETSTSAAFEVNARAEAFEAAAAANYAENIKIEFGTDAKLSLAQEVELATTRVNNALESFASNDEIIGAEFNSIIKSVREDIPFYTENPLSFGEAMSKAIRLPVGIEGRVGSKLQSYKSLIDTLPFRSTIDTLPNSKNALQVDELLGTSAIVAAAESANIAVLKTSAVVRGPSDGAIVRVPAATFGYQTRGETLAAAVFLRDNFVLVTQTLDAGQTAFIGASLTDMYIQAVESYNPTAAVVQLVIQTALDLSFTLPAERFLTLVADSTIMNECFKFYGNLEDETLDFFIQTNELSGEEILLLPRGKQVKFYA